MNLSELTEWPAVVQTPWLTQAAGGGGNSWAGERPISPPMVCCYKGQSRVKCCLNVQTYITLESKPSAGLRGFQSHG